MLVHTRHMGQDLEVLRRIATHKGHKRETNRKRKLMRKGEKRLEKEE